MQFHNSRIIGLCQMWMSRCGSVGSGGRAMGRCRWPVARAQRIDILESGVGSRILLLTCYERLLAMGLEPPESEHCYGEDRKNKHPGPESTAGTRRSRRDLSRLHSLCHPISPPSPAASPDGPEASGPAAMEPPACIRPGSMDLARGPGTARSPSSHGMRSGVRPCQMDVHAYAKKQGRDRDPSPARHTRPQRWN